MPPRFVIDIKPHRYGWTCEEQLGEQRVFVLKAQALHFAQQRCAAVAAEIRVRDRHGALQETLRVEPVQQHLAA